MLVTSIFYFLQIFSALPETNLTQSRLLMTLKKESFKNNVGKGENARNQHFLLFPQCFLLYQREKSSFSNVSLLSADAINLVISKILLFGKRLNDIYLSPANAFNYD